MSEKIEGQATGKFRLAKKILAFAAQVIPLLCAGAVTISIYYIKPIPNATESLFLDLESWTFLNVVFAYCSHHLIIPPFLCFVSGYWVRKDMNSFLAPVACVLLLPTTLLCSFLIWWEWLYFPPGTVLRV